MLDRAGLRKNVVVDLASCAHEAGWTPFHALTGRNELVSGHHPSSEIREELFAQADPSWSLVEYEHGRAERVGKSCVPRAAEVGAVAARDKRSDRHQSMLEAVYGSDLRRHVVL